jgi:hypothetical protein
MKSIETKQITANLKSLSMMRLGLKIVTLRNSCDFSGGPVGCFK